jgi:hypothetical protein
MKSFIERCKDGEFKGRPVPDPVEYKRAKPQEVVTGQRITRADIDALNAQIKRDNCPF